MGTPIALGRWVTLCTFLLLGVSSVWAASKGDSDSKVRPTVDHILAPVLDAKEVASSQHVAQMKRTLTLKNKIERKATVASDDEALALSKKQKLKAADQTKLAVVKETERDRGLRAAIKRQGVWGVPKRLRKFCTSKDAALVAPITGRLISPFGKRKLGQEKEDFHLGIDIQKGSTRLQQQWNVHAKVVAAAPGVVAEVHSGCINGDRECGDGRGNYIILSHEGVLEPSVATKTVYTHLVRVKVEKGDKVSRDEVIGHAGHTGRLAGIRVKGHPHLHFEVYRIKDGKEQPVDPCQKGLLRCGYYFIHGTCLALTSRDRVKVVEGKLTSCRPPAEFDASSLQLKTVRHVQNAQRAKERVLRQQSLRTSRLYEQLKAFINGLRRIAINNDVAGAEDLPVFKDLPPCGPNETPCINDTLYKPLVEAVGQKRIRRLVRNIVGGKANFQRRGRWMDPLLHVRLCSNGIRLTDNPGGKFFLFSELADRFGFNFGTVNQVDHAATQDTDPVLLSTSSEEGPSQGACGLCQRLFVLGSELYSNYNVNLQTVEQSLTPVCKAVNAASTSGKLPCASIMQWLREVHDKAVAAEHSRGSKKPLGQATGHLLDSLSQWHKRAEGICAHFGVLGCVKST